jgi:hypothetical protein
VFVLVGSLSVTSAVISYSQPTCGVPDAGNSAGSDIVPFETKPPALPPPPTEPNETIFEGGPKYAMAFYFFITKFCKIMFGLLLL